MKRRRRRKCKHYYDLIQVNINDVGECGSDDEDVADDNDAEEKNGDI
jgi:hypothetical protein